jgi:hypothetical protein
MKLKPMNETYVRVETKKIEAKETHRKNPIHLKTFNESTGVKLRRRYYH